MAENYILLERTELNADAASVTFSNIPQTGYTDLKIVYSVRVNTTNDLFILGFNGSTTGYSNRWIYGNGSSVSSGNNGSYTQLISWVDTSDNTASTFGNAEVYIPNYTSSNYKSYSADFVSENNATGAEAGFMASLWSNTAAITSIKFESIIGANLLAGSTFSLYGIAALGTTPAIAPKATGGNVIATDGTYWYHTFLATGAFVPAVSLTCDALVVAGGGGGGWFDGGGGGAGGLVFSSGESFTATSYAVTVGAGGTGASNTVTGGNGTNSTLLSYVATGGGGGGSQNVSPYNGNNGGSGGGAAENGGAHTGGTSTQTSYSGKGYGNAGGVSYGANPYVGGGGGGAGAIGGAGTAGGPGNGGNGLGGTTIATLNAMGSATSTGQLVSGNYYYAGGGGAAQAYTNAVGTGGYGGGGAGVAGATGTQGTANTGGGGGCGAGNAGSTSFVGGTGGSGIVIIRYPIV